MQEVEQQGKQSYFLCDSCPALTPAHFGVKEPLTLFKYLL